MLSFLFKPSLEIQDKNPNKQLVMIANFEKFFMKIYQEGFDWWAGVEREDPYDQGVWYFEPPLPTELYDELPTFDETTTFIASAPARVPRSVLMLSFVSFLLAM